MLRTPARVSSTMIQMANSTTVRTIVVSPRPNSTMITGTSADSGAEMNMVPQGRRMRSARSERPIATPIGIPTGMAIALPITNVLAVIASAPRKVGVGTISTILAKIAESGGMTKLAPLRPAISQRIAQMTSEANSGTLIFPMVMACSFEIALETLPDGLDGIEIGLAAANPLGIAAAIDRRRHDLRHAAWAFRQQHDAVRHIDRLLDRMRHEDEGLPLLRHQPQEIL